MNPPRVTNSTRPKVKYIADLSGVREVLLSGTADLAYWQSRLRGENLELAVSGGRVKLLINATSARFMGVRFRELNLSVLVGRAEPAYYLARAYNSSRFFAFCERNWFGTPYYHAHIDVEDRYPADMRLIVDGRVALDAGIFADSEREREPLRRGAEHWEGPIYLPCDLRRPAAPGTLFHARLSGETVTYPFVPEEDTFVLDSSACPLSAMLAESGFRGETWSLRASARHARGKTLKRSMEQRDAPA